jgi:hypothetical protein
MSNNYRSHHIENFMDAIPNQNISQSMPLFFLQKYVKSQTKERESDHKFIIALMWENFNLSLEEKHIVTFFFLKQEKSMESLKPKLTHAQHFLSYQTKRTKNNSGDFVYICGI